MQVTENKQNKIRKVFLDDLPHKNGRVSWIDSIGYDIKFNCRGIEGKITLLSYISSNGKCEVLYNDKIYKTYISTIIDCKLSKIIGIIKSDYRYNIGEIVNDKLKITKQIKREDNLKIYEYECIKCGNKDKITEYSIKMGCSCNVCGSVPKKIVLGINSLFDTNPEVVKYLANKEDANKYSKGSSKKVEWICKDCGQHKKLSPATFIEHGIMCNRCSDGKSMPNKIMFSILQQLLGNNFENEKLFKWCNFKKYNEDKITKGYYDFYFKINNKEYIIEMDGELGHGNNTTFTTANETNYIDNVKDNLAREHNINVIRIPCPAKFDTIKHNILHSELSYILDLNKIDWERCLKYSSTSLIFTAISYYNDGIEIIDISNKMKLDRSTVRKYLKLGFKMGECDYGSVEANKRQTEKENKRKRQLYSKEIICLENGKIFNSLHDCEKNSVKEFGIKMGISCLCRVCNGKSKDHKGYHFKYITDLTEEECIKYNIDRKSA